jgi:hypothetical protein
MAALGAAPVAQGQEQVLLTEFMAANTRSLPDRDRERSDWIELYNAGSKAANLEGWFLTDDRSRLNKWALPASTLAPNEFLIVFASKKDRRQPGAELHTNFKLEASGGYLALVRPDGKTIATEYSYPRQIANVAYGLDMADRNSVLLNATQPRRWLVPNRDIGAGWTGAEFDDGTWGTATNAADTAAIVAGQKARQTASAYVRIPFQLAAAEFESLRLRMNYQDGFVAYLNGREVARRNAPAAPAWNSQATNSRTNATGQALEENFDANPGSYVTAQLDPLTRPRISRASATETNGYLRLVNGRHTNQVNAITFPQITQGLFESFQADFDFRWRGNGEGTERLVFLLIPVTAYGASGNGVDLTSFREVRDPKFAGVLAVQLLHSPDNGQKALSVHWDRNKRATASLTSSSLGPRAFHHAQVRLRFVDGAGVLDVGLTDGANGQQFQPVSQLVIPGLQPFAARVQFAGRIGHWDQTLDLDAIRLRCVPVGEGAMEEFDLTAQAGTLRTGRNVLAIQGLNRAPGEAGFMADPFLLGSQSALGTKEGRYFALATPRAVNREGLTGMAPPPVFSQAGGVFASSLGLELSTPAGTVRYTLDGAEPNASSEAYTRPIALQNTTLVRARTFVPGLQPSPIVTETFTFLDEGAQGFSSNLPLLVLNPFGQHISPNNKTMVSVRVIDTVKGRSSLTGKADYDGRASVNIRGFSTLRQPKNSLTVRLKDENEDKVKAGLLGLPKESDWVLYAPYSDKTLLRDALAYELSNKMGRYAPRTRFVELYLDRSGGRLGPRDYMGVYVLVEKIKRGKNRVNIAELSGSDTSEPGISGGYIFKRDHSERWEPSFHTSRGGSFYYVDPQATEMTRDQMTWLTRYMTRFEQALYGSDFRDPTRGYGAYLDVDAFIDQHWLIEMSKNIDGFRYSAYLHKDRGGKLVVGPAWDWNLSFGNADYHDGSDPTGWYTSLLRESEICWFRRLSEDPEFEQHAIDRWSELRRTAFNTADILHRVDEMAAQLAEAQARNFRRWPILGRRVNPNDFVGSTYAEEIQWMKQWIQKRLQWIDNQFVSPPALTRAQGNVTLRGSGKIYYTLDGTDPRLPGGAPSPKATAYSSPLSLKPGARLVARAHSRGKWSGPISTANTSETRRPD